MDMEATMRAALDGKLYAVQYDERGARTVDLLAKPEPPSQELRPAAGDPVEAVVPGQTWPVEDLIQLVKLKRLGLNLTQISEVLNRDTDAIWRKWNGRETWRNLIDVPREGGTVVPSLPEIADAVCHANGITWQDFSKVGRTAKHCLARQQFYWLARRITKSPYYQIAQYMAKNHATVMHGYAKIERTRQEHAALIAAVLADLQIDLKTLDGQE